MKFSIGANEGPRDVVPMALKACDAEDSLGAVAAKAIGCTEAALLERVVRIEGYESIAQKTTVALDNAELQSTIRELRDEEVRSEIRA